MARLREYKKGVATKLSENFSSSEFDCRCNYPDCQWTRIDLEHVEKLQKLRDELGPLKVTSGYRCPKHNKDVGGASRSRHKEGDASDVQSYQKTPDEVADVADSHGFDGLGRYNTFTHLDSRGAHKARWDFRRR